MKNRLIDLHIHGYAGLDAQSAEPRELLRLSDRLGQEDLTGFLLTYVSAPLPSILNSLRAARAAIGREKGATILGVHLEGPFLNAVRAGAHVQKSLRNSTLSETREWLSVGKGLIKVVTLAPEMPGADKVIRYLVSHGIRVQMGHTTATAAQAKKAKSWGVTGVTHLFNAMGPKDRREASLADFVLEDKDLYTELIIDGVHVSDELVAHTLKKRPKDKVIFISDCCAASGFPVGHRTRFAGESVVTAPDGSLRRKDGTLAASGLLLPHALRRTTRNGPFSSRKIGSLDSLNPLRYLSLGS
jgi:N-acetylglucosamine-6-phosphate deacetylase